MSGGLSQITMYVADRFHNNMILSCPAVTDDTNGIGCTVFFLGSSGLMDLAHHACPCSVTVLCDTVMCNLRFRSQVKLQAVPGTIRVQELLHTPRPKMPPFWCLATMVVCNFYQPELHRSPFTHSLAHTVHIIGVLHKRFSEIFHVQAHRKSRQVFDLCNVECGSLGDPHVALFVAGCHANSHLRGSDTLWRVGRLFLRRTRERRLLSRLLPL